MLLIKQNNEESFWIHETNNCDKNEYHPLDDISIVTTFC